MSERGSVDRHRRPRSAQRFVVVIGVLLALCGLALDAGVAHAHTGFESSTPAAGDTIDEPVEIVTIVFTGEATPVGDEFVALTPDGVVQEPTSVSTVDDKVFSIRFDPPLAGGQIGIRWNVQAADAHPIEGAFAFTVNAPPATTTAPTTTPPVEEAASPASVDPADASQGNTVDTAIAADGATNPPAPVTEEAQAAPTIAETAAAAEPAAPPAQSLDEFLAVDNSTPGETTATIGRLVGLLGAVIGLGALAFVAAALRGRREEVAAALNGVRALAGVIAIGASIEYVGVSRIGAESLTSGWSTAPGFATVMRLVGGLALVVGLVGTITRTQVRTSTGRMSARSLSSAVIDNVATAPDAGNDDSPIVRWKPDARSWPVLAGVIVIVASFWFDGHTVSKGFRPLHALVNSVHVLAGAVWVGGVVAMAAIIWTRYRSGRPMRVVELVVRFSKIATIALASVVLAGGVMAFLVLDSPGELTGTPWGKILLLKTAAVGLAMIGGAYNHFRLLPALEADPESPELLTELRSTVTAEAIMLVFVVTVTAWLVAAAS